MSLVLHAVACLQENPLYLARAERERIARGEVAKDSKAGKKKKAQ
jgi:hypothetical protein